MKATVWNNIQTHIPRILSQLDRDFDSPTCGSFDRNFWNYKIRDFSSIILQQGVLILDVIYNYKSDENKYYQKEVIKKWIEAGVNFWVKSQLKTGAFNEYYPYESGFPPTAFSLYAIALTLHKYPEFASTEALSAVSKAGAWLLNHPEREALNQESAALSGMVVASKLKAVSINENKLNERLEEFYNSQSSEGWFNEYDGPDLGYLTVTLDSLWDIYEFSKDERALKALEKATDFISLFVSVSGQTPVMINSRNTDYMVPYGLAGYGSINPKAKDLAKVMLDNLNKPDSCFHTTDDRYMSHYVGQSYFRSIANIDDYSKEIEKPDVLSGSKYLPDCGIFIKHIEGEKSIYIAAKKGGVVNIYNEGGVEEVNFGWRYNDDGKVAVTHWQSTKNKVHYENDGDEDKIVVKGDFTTHGFLRPSPFKHMVLRIIAFLFGNSLIPMLKSKLIFSDKATEVGFVREVLVKGSEVKVVDEFVNQGDKKFYKAPHYSMRHVSSAGRFVEEELL